ncbi:MAG: GNAT family N-acetyltransferase [Planctomycetes bacterium]|nr:GNAT family N-acetyltransferase [Planctomycetota bacterium]
MLVITVEETDLGRSEDQKAVLGLIKEFAREITGDLPPDVCDRLIPGLRSLATALVFLAYCDKRPVGLAICFIGFSTFTGRRLINIHDLYVQQRYQRQGVGGCMLKAIERRANELDCGKLTLEVQENNTKAQRFYANFGFEEVRYKAEAGPLRFWQKSLL